MEIFFGIKEKILLNIHNSQEGKEKNMRWNKEKFMQLMQIAKNNSDAQGTQKFQLHSRGVLQ
jgi:hypothetical protein